MSRVPCLSLVLMLVLPVWLRAEDRPLLLLPAAEPVSPHFKVALEQIEKKNWSVAATLLQHLLDQDPGPVVAVRRKGPGGKERTVGIRAEVNRVIANLPDEGWDEYQKEYGPKAAELVQRARKINDVQLLARAARRYLWTDAGREAVTALLEQPQLSVDPSFFLEVTHRYLNTRTAPFYFGFSSTTAGHEKTRRYLNSRTGRAPSSAREDTEAIEQLVLQLLDRGQVSTALLCFEQLLAAVDAGQLAPLPLFKAVLAYGRSDDTKRFEQVRKILGAKLGKEGLVIGGKKLSLEELRKEAEKQRPARVVAGELHEWRMFRGDPTRSASAVGGVPFLEPRWTYEIFTEKQTRDWLNRASAVLRESKQPILSPFHPIAVVFKSQAGDIPLVVQRSYFGIHARTLLGVPTEQPPLKPGDLYWEAPSMWSVDRMVREPRHVGALSNWMRTYLTEKVRPGILFENTLVGSLSVDGSRVYAVEDFQVPPSIPGQRDGRFGQQPFGGAALSNAFQHNRLQAYDLESGKLLWEVGEHKDKGELNDSFFLSPPLPLNGKLHVLNEKDGELRLVTLHADTGEVWAGRKLARFRDKMTEVVNRRVDAAHLAYADGILICPTNAGAVLGVEEKTGRPVWAFGYETLKRELQPGAGQVAPDESASRWRASAPLIAQGKVVLAPSDGDTLACVNLRSGRLLWQHPREKDDLYVGGIIEDVVVVVSNRSCRGLKLADGKAAWRLDTGMPSGLGVVAGKMFYLPLAESSRTQQPGITVIDPVKGIVVSHVRSRTQEVPGNLCFAGDLLISQTATHITAYPLLQAESKAIDKLLKKNANDPEGLARRGDLRLDRGDLKGAIDDFRIALQWKPNDALHARLRERFYEAMLELAERDFAAAEPYLKDFEALSREPPRLGRYLIASARGLEKQGKRVEAARLYLDLAGRGAAEMIEVPADPGLKVSATLFARKRIEAMLKTATLEERKRIEQEVKDWLKKTEARQAPHTLRGIVVVFGADSVAGREARLELANQLTLPNEFLEAEKLLLEVRWQHQDMSAAARALDTLALLCVRRGLMMDAVAHFRELARDFATIKVRDGRTGKELLDDLATDKRFLPYLLEQVAPVKKRFKVMEEKGVFGPTGFFDVDGLGDRLPFFQKQRLVMLANDRLDLFDPRANQMRWRLKLREPPGADLWNRVYDLGSARMRFHYHTLNHLAIVPLGPVTVALDPVAGRILWEKNTASKPAPSIRLRSLNPDDDSVTLFYQDGSTQRVSLRGIVSASTVVLHRGHHGLTGVDPLTGQILWERTGLADSLDLFHDDNHLFVLELNAQREARATRVLSLADGSPVMAADFSELYRHKARFQRGRLLLVDRAGERLTLRQYDPLAGKDLWSAAFPGRSTVLKSTDENLAGVVEPDGKVSVYDLDTGKEVLKAQMKAEHLKDVEEVYLIGDRDCFYLACRKPPGPKARSVALNLTTDWSWRTAQVNGMIYCFNNDGKLRWAREAQDQFLILNQLREMPVLLLTANSDWDLHQGISTTRVTRIYEKQTGNLIHEQKNANTDPEFHSLNVDEARGIFELVGASLKLRIQPRE